MNNQAYELGFARIGEDVLIWERAKIVNAPRIELGDSVIIDDFSLVIGGESTVIGSFVHIAAYVLIAGGGRLVLGDFCGLSGGVKVYTGDDDYLGGSLTGPTVPPIYRTPFRSSVQLGRHVIVGANTVILPGVTIGEGVAIGANSLIKHDCEPWTVYGGSPARPLRDRPSAKILEMERLLRADLYDSEGRYKPRGTMLERP